MRLDKSIYLLSDSSETIVEDAIGNQKPTFSERLVYARESMVGSNEFYNAAATGLRPEIQFEMYADEYKGEKKLKYNDIIYNIIRTRSLWKTSRSAGRTVYPDPKWIGLICERVIGNNQHLH